MNLRLRQEYGEGGRSLLGFAHITPTYDMARNLFGFHSNRRAPDPRIVKEAIAPLYDTLLKTENATANAKEGLAESYRQFLDVVHSKARSGLLSGLGKRVTPTQDNQEGLRRERRV
jgi:hypothetical protein